MTTLNATEARSKLYALIDEATDTHQPIVITGKGVTLSCLQRLLAIVEVDPYQNPPPYEKLVGGLSGVSSRRINIQHRLVYQVLEKEKLIKVLRLWSYYE